MHSYPCGTSPKSHPNRSLGGVFSWRAFNIGTYPMDKIGRCLGSESCCWIAWIVNNTFIDVSAFSIDSYWVLITNTVVSRFFIDTNFWRAAIMCLSKTLLYMGSRTYNKPNRVASAGGVRNHFPACQHIQLHHHLCIHRNKSNRILHRDSNNRHWRDSYEV